MEGIGVLHADVPCTSVVILGVVFAGVLDRGVEVGMRADLSGVKVWL